jgi:hypothetical protein
MVYNAYVYIDMCVCVCVYVYRCIYMYMMKVGWQVDLAGVYTQVYRQMVCNAYVTIYGIHVYMFVCVALFLYVYMCILRKWICTLEYQQKVCKIFAYIYGIHVYVSVYVCMYLYMCIHVYCECGLIGRSGRGLYTRILTNGI